MAEYSTPEWHPAFEEYCEAIWELAEDDIAVIQARIAERLDVSRPAVSEMIRKLDTEGLVATEDGKIGLTPARSEEHTSELQSLMRISYAVFCLKKQINNTPHKTQKE